MDGKSRQGSETAKGGLLACRVYKNYGLELLWEISHRGSFPSRAYKAILFSAVLCNVILFFIRFLSVLKTRGMIPASGVEGSGSLGIYNVCNGNTLYHNFAETPNIFIFNFLFYDFYGYILKTVAPCAEAVPLDGRVLTLGLLAFAVVSVISIRNKVLTLLEVVLVSSTLLSVYVGWWAFALRPDVGALAFLLAGLACAIRYFKSTNLLTGVLAVIFLAFAWGFKQPLGLAAPIFLWFAFQTNRKHVFVMACIFMFCIISPLFFFDIQSYLTHTVLAATTGRPFSFSIATSNLTSFIVKASPLVVATIALSKLTWPTKLEERFLLTFILTSLCLLFVMAGKPGAGDNYFFPTFGAMLIFAVYCLPRTVAPLRTFILLGYAVVSVTVTIAVLSGMGGRTSLSSDDLDRLSGLAGVINRLPEPRLVQHDDLALPWFTTNVSTRLVVYNLDMLAERSNEQPVHVDVKALVKNKYYAAVVIGAGSMLENYFDLNGYERARELDGIVIFLRK